MTAAFEEVLMGLGSWDLSVDWHPDLADDLAIYNHVLIWWGERHIYTGLILSRQPSRIGLVVGGHGLDSWLGVEDTGPVIVDREYVSGANKLSNGGFESEDKQWRLAEGTGWQIRSVADEPRVGLWAAAVAAELAEGATGDDVLQSDESFECFAGQLFNTLAHVRRISGEVGRLRLRTVYEGRFDPPNLLPADDTSDFFTDVSYNPADAVIMNNPEQARSGSWVMRIGPVTQRQLLANPGFEDGDAFWYAEDDGWEHTGDDAHAGDSSMRTAGNGPGRVVLQATSVDGVSDPADVAPYTVKPGERLKFEAFVRAAVASAGASEATGVCKLVLLLTDDVDDPDDRVYVESSAFDLHDPAADWRVTPLEVDVAEGKTQAVPMVHAFDVLDGGWYVDDITLTVVKGNTAVLRSAEIPVTPQQSYKLSASVRSGADVAGGAVKLAARMTGPGRPLVVTESSAVENTEEDWKTVAVDVTPPSGYDTVVVDVVGLDIVGDPFWVDDLTLRLTDTSKVVVDAVSAEDGYNWSRLDADTVAPAGAERIHVELVAETLAAGWRVDDVALTRSETPVQVKAVVADLLADPDTGGPLLAPGRIVGEDLLRYDWHLRRMTNRDALRHLSTAGVASPTREWRVRPDATLDWATAEELFADRAGFVLTDSDLFVVDAPDLVEDATTRPTRVLLVGADRRPVGLVAGTVEGTAENPAAGAADWFGNPVRRTLLVEDSTVDQQDYADAFARYKADQAAEPPQNVAFGLADWSALGAFDVGDWIYVHHPAAGVEDPANPVDVDGATIWPARKRCISRRLRMGGGSFRVEVRRGDGSIVDISGAVRWEDRTDAVVELGDPLSEFVVDPQGGPARDQFKRWRTSAPR